MYESAEITCNVCSKDFVCEFLSKRRKSARLLPVVICRYCLKCYGYRKIPRTQDATDRYCHWCKHGVKFYVGRKFQSAFYNKYVKQNLERIFGHPEDHDRRCTLCHSKTPLKISWNFSSENHRSLNFTRKYQLRKVQKEPGNGSEIPTLDQSAHSIAVTRARLSGLIKKTDSSIFKNSFMNILVDNRSLSSVSDLNSLMKNLITIADSKIDTLLLFKHQLIDSIEEDIKLIDASISQVSTDVDSIQREGKGNSVHSLTASEHSTRWNDEYPITREVDLEVAECKNTVHNGRYSANNSEDTTPLSEIEGIVNSKYSDMKNCSKVNLKSSRIEKLSKPKILKKSIEEHETKSSNMKLKSTNELFDVSVGVRKSPIRRRQSPATEKPNIDKPNPNLNWISISGEEEESTELHEKVMAAPTLEMTTTKVNPKTQFSTYEGNDGKSGCHIYEMNHNPEIIGIPSMVNQSEDCSSDLSEQVAQKPETTLRNGNSPEPSHIPIADVLTISWKSLFY